VNTYTFARTMSASILVTLSLMNQSAAGNVINVSADQISRLGIAVGRPEAVADVAIASAPAEVVIPPMQEAVVSTPVGGLISRLLVATGEAVVSGQALAEIRSTEFMDLQREYLDAVAADELAQAQLDRDAGLHRDGIIAMRRLQEATVQARAARLLRDQMLQQLQIAGQDDSQISGLIQRRELITTLILRAPFDGVVVAQNTKVGSSVGSLEPVMRIADLQHLWLEAHVPQELATRIDLGMTIAATTAEGVLFGSIVNIGRVVDRATQTVLVRAAVDNEHGDLRAGQFLNTEIISAREDASAFAIPGGAVTRVGTDTLVFARNAQGFEVIRVELLASDGDRLYIGDGVDQATEIAVDGVSALKSLWMSLQDQGD